MKKHIAISILLFNIALNSYSQNGIQQRSWEDGEPGFSQIEGVVGIDVDSTVRLIPQYAVHHADSFQYILYGESGLWPVQKFPINEGNDIDFISENKNYYLISDGLGRKVFEINYTDPQNPISAGFSFAGDKLPLVKPIDASIFYENNNRKILITDNGGHRVIKVDRLGGDEEWAYGDGSSGIGFNRLSGPSDAVALPDVTHFLICDQGNSRIIEVNSIDNSIVWTYSGEGLFNPVDIEYDSSTNEVLITDQINHRVIFVKKDENQDITWQFGTGVAAGGREGLNTPTDADILANGNILISDKGNYRLIEVDRSGEIVWSFAHRKLYNLKDADRLPDNRTIIIGNYPATGFTNIPIWLGYSDSTFTSEKQILNKNVNIDSIFWDSDTPPNTTIKVQFRSSNDYSGLDAVPWQGPSATDLFFTDPASAVIKLNNLARSFYQFKAVLETDDPLYTPILNDFQIRSNYFDNTIQGILTSDIITDSANYVITSWQNLEFTTEQYSPREIRINILDANTNAIIKTYFAEETGLKLNAFPLTDAPKLQGVQAIRLQAVIQTAQTSTTPVLHSWGIEWNRIFSTPAKIAFTNADGEDVPYYRFIELSTPSQKNVDQVFVSLTDENLASVQDTISLRMETIVTEDKCDVLLERTTDPSGRFQMKRAVQGYIFNIASYNSTIEALDRDTLHVTYTDPTNSADTCSDTVLIIQNTSGIIKIVDAYNTELDTVAIGDTIFVHIANEMDRNITHSQDTIYVEVFDNITDDSEFLPLLELPDSNGTYYSGNFMSEFGLPVTLSPTGISDDWVIQTLRSNQIGARYVDNVTIQDQIEVERGPEPIVPDSIIMYPQKQLDFDVAPNPYYTDQNDFLKLRASSTIGDLTVEKIEIYNIAGLRVRLIHGENIQFNLGQPIPRNTYAFSSNWWNLTNDQNEPVRSGIYWIKMYGYFTDETGTRSNQLSDFKKVVIIR
ncbi:hypothetical protein JXB12_08425 [candidate division KSB1 bacterium]|nr:hypothetical protein [candidate division KSB1 bacterium]